MPVSRNSRKSQRSRSKNSRKAIRGGGNNSNTSRMKYIFAEKQILTQANQGLGSVINKIKSLHKFGSDYGVLNLEDDKTTVTHNKLIMETTTADGFVTFTLDSRTGKITFEATENWLDAIEAINEIRLALEDLSKKFVIKVPSHIN